MQQPMIAPARKPLAPDFISSRPYMRINAAVASKKRRARKTNTDALARASLTKTKVAPQIRVQPMSRRSALSFKRTRAELAGSIGGGIQPRHLQQCQQEPLHPNLAAGGIVPFLQRMSTAGSSSGSEVNRGNAERRRNICIRGGAFHA